MIDSACLLVAQCVSCQVYCKGMRSERHSGGSLVAAVAKALNLLASSDRSNRFYGCHWRISSKHVFHTETHQTQTAVVSKTGTNVSETTARYTLPAPYPHRADRFGRQVTLT